MKAKQAISGTSCKVAAFILCILFTALSALSAVVAIGLLDSKAYTSSRSVFLNDAMYGQVYYAGERISNRIEWMTYPELDEFSQGNLRFAIYTGDGTLLETNCENPEQMSWQYENTYCFESDSENERFDDEISRRDEWGDTRYTREYLFYASLAEGLPATDQYSFSYDGLSLAYSLRYGIYAIGLAAVVLAIACFVLLMCGAGHRRGQEGIVPGPLMRVPFDLFAVVIALAIIGPFAVVADFGDGLLNMVGNLILIALASLFALTVFLGFCMSAAVRIKLGTWWNNTVIYRVARLCWRGLRAMGHGAATLLRSLPLIWRTALLFVAVCVLELIGIAACYWSTEALMFLWFLEKLILAPAVLYLALVLRRLQKGGRALADGDLSYQVDTSKMIWDFKQHGEHLNSIAGGMSHAVDERLKSERLKTELITNVSHDIKTPLTSIINYADLIGKEQTENPKITEYCEVLTRQSERLKKLIEDLVEASKASTGNVEVLLAPCAAGVLLTQTAGEYEKRLAAGGLALVVRKPEMPVNIMADGRLLWRVFDNLMNNICKYAQEGTRVYLSLEQQGGEVQISFKNTSKYALDISSEELLERFVRGDSSRSTEGSGLGLSIAQSLTELQGGKMALTIDGDLFKVTLRFAMIP